MDCSTPDFHVLHYRMEFAQTQVLWVDDAIQPSHPLLSPSPALNLRQHQSVFQEFTSGGQSIGACFSISPSNECSGLISFRIDWFDLLAVLRDSQESSPAPQFKSIHSSAFSLLNCPTLTSIHDYWKNHSLDYTDLCQQNDIWFLICCLGLS